MGGKEESVDWSAAWEQEVTNELTEHTRKVKLESWHQKFLILGEFLASMLCGTPGDCGKKPPLQISG